MSSIQYARLRHRLFIPAWEDLRVEGVVDEPFGAQYARVLLAWRKAGCPADVERFILENAELLPEALEEDTSV